jgi:hypothetical protein
LKFRHVIAGLCLAAAVAASTPLLASSEDAWKEFRANVQKGCEAAVGDKLVKPTYTVDPFGTDSYGVAIARGPSKYNKAPKVIVCVFDKKTLKTEATEELSP